MLRRNRRTAPGSPRPLLAACAALPLLLACASRSEIPRDFAWTPPESSAHSQAPQSGEALLRRKGELRRAERDLVHFQRTLLSLQHRRERGSFMLLASFLDAYFGLHLDPLLQEEWQAEHPELIALDAGLRLRKAELFIIARDPGRAEGTLDELRRRYDHRDDLLVEYPEGHTGTLGEAIQILRERKWWRG